MKIVIPSPDGDINGTIDSRFGRANYFIIIDYENGSIINHRAIQNPGATEVRGAGFIAAETVANQNPDILITPNLGPNSFNILSRTNIKIYQYYGNIHDAINLLEENKLPLLTNYTSQGQGQGFGFGRGRGMGRGRRW